MITATQWIGMFLLGLRDSISVDWIKNTLLFIDPKTKRVHPSSKQLFMSLKSSLIKILLYVIVVPSIFEYLQFFDLFSISTLFKIVYLILTYGYLFFLNNDIMVSTRKLIFWQHNRNSTVQEKNKLNFGKANRATYSQPKNSALTNQGRNSCNISNTDRQIQQNNSNDNQNMKNNKNYQKNTNFQLDKIQRIQFFTLLSSQIKSFIFLLFYYLPIFIIQTKILSLIPYFGILVLIISQSFFNGVFYFLKTWPFDKYNIGFIEKQMPYMIGYGFFVSLVCNYLLKGYFATGGYLIISLWMLINSVIYSPPQIQFKSFDQILKVIFDSKIRNGLKNGYNVHRDNIKTNQSYRDEIVKKIFIVYPALKITQIFNSKISILLQKNSLNFQPQTTHSGSDNLKPASLQIKRKEAESKLDQQQNYIYQNLNNMKKINSNDQTRVSINQSENSFVDSQLDQRVIIQLDESQEDKDQ